MVLFMSGTRPAMASILAASSSSGASRWVSHGVGLVQPIETIVNPPRSMTFPSANVTDGADSRIGSISKMSSLPPLRMHGIAPPRSLPSAMSSQRSSERVISALNRSVIAPRRAS